LVVGCFVILGVTGLYLLLFYRISAPYESLARITDQPFAGRWIRGLHRYISDLAIVAALIHAFRMGVQDRAWGPRTLAWISGIVLFVIFLICGWTGYVMVWDGQAQMLAIEGARLFDALPIFSEPIGRTFVGERAMPSAFFFLNLFAHIAIPVGVLLVLWIHVSRLARTYLLPPRGLFWGTVAVFTLVAVLWPVSLQPEADLLTVPNRVPIDLFYNFWVPLTQPMAAGWVWFTIVAVLGVSVSIPFLTRPRSADVPARSVVHPRHCTGCEQCYHDCPYEAISMVARDDGREGFVGLVDPLKCVSCGICAGSCAPMGVGPEGRAGRDQLQQVKDFIERVRPTRDDVVLVACSNSAAGWGAEEVQGAPVFPVSCAGSMHSSVVEYLIRAGSGGVMVVSCPPRDCWNREGVAWLEGRLYERREAELKDRVDRRRVRVEYAAEREGASLARSIERFRAQGLTLERALKEEVIQIDTVCEPPSVSVAEDTSP
jgi:ferredoxin